MSSTGRGSRTCTSGGCRIALCLRSICDHGDIPYPSFTRNSDSQYTVDSGVCGAPPHPASATRTRSLSPRETLTTRTITIYIRPKYELSRPRVLHIRDRVSHTRAASCMTLMRAPRLPVMSGFSPLSRFARASAARSVSCKPTDRLSVIIIVLIATYIIPHRTLCCRATSRTRSTDR
jgi:hypothetical protein